MTKKGLVLGKFMPLHKGHLALIDFAAQHCDELTVLLCYNHSESISGGQRLRWLKESLQDYPSLVIDSFLYDKNELTSSSVFSESAAAKWAFVLKERYPEVNIFFSSEAYGEAVARAINIEHIAFDSDRNLIPVSGSQIRANPFRYWDYLPRSVQPYFVRKVCIVGSESTGKTTLTEKLARQFHTTFVPEMARDIIAHTESCTFDDLYKIAELQAQTIKAKQLQANRILFCDTDVNITKSYARYLFGKKLNIPQWIEEANTFDLYLFLETDCPYVQDGTRLSEAERNKLSESHKQQLEKAGISFISIRGDWEQRFEYCCALIKQKYVTW